MKNIHFTYGHVCRCGEFANVIENTYQLTNLWKKQRSFLSLEFMIDDTGEMAWYFLQIV